MSMSGSMKQAGLQALTGIVSLAGFELVKKEKFHDGPLYQRHFPQDSMDNRRFFNISAGGHIGFGCGFDHPYWTNIDVDQPWQPPSRGFRPGLDLAHDLLDLGPLPVATESAELAHSRFSVEHITDEAARVMFREVHRILKPKGTFRVVCPNIDLDYRAYRNNDREYFYWSFNVPELRTASMEQLFIEHFAGTASILQSSPSEKVEDDEFRELLRSRPLPEVLDACTARCTVALQKARRRNHINWWNFTKLQTFLREAGFREVVQSAAQQSLSPAMRNPRYFDNLYNEVALYVDARKD